MPTDNPRLNVTLPPETHQAVSLFATARGLSMSEAARQLLDDALDRQEEIYLAKILTARSADTGPSVSHEDAWS